LVLPLCLGRYIVDERPATRPGDGADSQRMCTEVLSSLQARFDAQAAQMEKFRKQQLPGRR